MTRPELIAAFERLLARGSCWPAGRDLIVACLRALRGRR